MSKISISQGKSNLEHETVHLILASSSRYRQELLTRLQLEFVAIAPEIDETPIEGETPEKTALRLAREKAMHIAMANPESIVIGSDQVATVDGAQIGKPGNHENALRQLQFMRGRLVIFHTAICVFDGRANKIGSALQCQIYDCQTEVKFRDLPDEELDAYLHIEQPYDCAGSAKNEGLGITIIESIISKDPTSLTGLPLIALTSMLRNLGVGFYRQSN